MADDEKKFDWRILEYFFLPQDLPPTFPGGPSSKRGDPVFVCSLTRTARGNLIGFTQPRPAAMAMNISITHALRANAIFQSLNLIKTATPHGVGLQIDVKDTSNLFDYFECCMTSVTFSIQSLDTFCNEIISTSVKGTLPILLGKKTKYLKKTELESKNFSLKMKIGTILPKIFSISSPETSADNKIWNRYLELERIRNTTVHLKTTDQNKGIQIDEESLFFEFFRTNAKGFPSSALDVMDYFKPHIAHHDWIDDARNLLDNP